MDRTPKQVPPSTPPDLSVPPTSKHTAEPWEVRATTDPTADFAFAITHPLDDLHICKEHVCLVYAGDHARANAALIRLSPRMARVLSELFQSFLFLKGEVQGLRGRLSPPEEYVDYVGEIAIRTRELLDDLKKAGGL